MQEVKLAWVLGRAWILSFLNRPVFSPSLIILVERKYHISRRELMMALLSNLVLWEFWGESHLIRRPILLGKELDTGFLSV